MARGGKPRLDEEREANEKPGPPRFGMRSTGAEQPVVGVKVL